MDGSQAAVAAALENQLTRLVRVAQQLEFSSRSLGHRGDGAGEGIWRGPAHNAWLGTLDELRRDLTESCSLIETAVTNTRRAIATLVDRG